MRYGRLVVIAENVSRDGQDPRELRDVLARERVEVAVPVPALVVVADAGADRVEVRQVAEDRVAEGHVLLDDVELLVGQLARLAQDLVRDADLADVVQQPREPQRAELVRPVPSRVPMNIAYRATSSEWRFV